MNEYTHIDLSHLYGIAKGSPELINKYINIYLTTVPPKIKQLETLVLDENRDEIKKNIHFLKSNCMYMGASSLAEKLQKLNSDLDHRILLDVVKESEKVKNELGLYLSNNKVC